MMRYFAAVATEVMKLKRSLVPPVTLAVSALLAAVLGLFFWMLLHPGVAETLGLLGTKAKVALGGETLDGPTFWNLVTQISAMAGLFLSAVTVAFVFGRESAEGTAKVLYTLPVPRTVFVAAKLTVATLWYLVLVAVMAASAWVTGTLVGVPGLTTALAAGAVLRMGGLALLVVGSSSLTALVTVASRGYFAPLGYAVGTLSLASVFGHTGWGPWVPWSIVGLASGAAGPGEALGPANYAVVGLTFVVGAVATAVHEERADNRQ